MGRGWKAIRAPRQRTNLDWLEKAAGGASFSLRRAVELGEGTDTLLGLAGKVSGDLLAIIRERPAVVAELLRSVRRMSARRVSDLSRQRERGPRVPADLPVIDPEPVKGCP